MRAEKVLNKKTHLTPQLCVLPPPHPPPRQRPLTTSSMASLESALEEERLAILELLEKPRNAPSSRTSASVPSSPALVPPNPYRGVSPSGRKVASLIDAAVDYDPPRSSGRNSRPNSRPSSRPASARTSPTLMYASLAQPPRSGGPRLLKDLDKDKAAYTPNPDYNFSILPSAVPGMPKRTTQKNPKSMIDAAEGPGAGFRRSAGDLGLGKRHFRSGSPVSNAAMRHAARSVSPQPGHGNARNSTGMLPLIAPSMGSSPKNTIITGNGVEIDLDRAYTRLTDEALANSGGVLQLLPEKKGVLDTTSGEFIKPGQGESVTGDGGVRLQKDYDFSKGGEGAEKDDTTDTDGSDNDSDGSFSASEDERGRKGGPEGETKRKTMSLLAAAEEERKQVSAKQKSKYKVKSLLPSVSVTPAPGSPTVSGRRKGVVPNTNFDAASAASTPMNSDQEQDFADYRRAQKMEMNISPITNLPDIHRAYRVITRGDFEELQHEAEMGNRRQRCYVVATDLSAEAAYALEWTIGTVLRDGDTILCVNLIDAEATGGKLSDNEPLTPAATTLLDASNPASPSPPTTPATPGFPLNSSTPHLDVSTPPAQSRAPSQSRPTAVSERINNIEQITTLLTRLLRKTRLQVRIIIESMTVKSPRHKLTEIIDMIEPTLVVLGSRGRSALKGVLLGSFSNYLVTKSSVPVMVARRRLKRGRGRVNVRLSNNLVAGALGGGRMGLASAKVD